MILDSSISFLYTILGLLLQAFTLKKLIYRILPHARLFRVVLYLIFVGKEECSRATSVA